MVSSVWDKVANALPPIRDDEHAKENADIVREWLQSSAEGRCTTQQFDQAIELGYYIFQYTALYGPKDEYWPECVKQIDRRQAARGLGYCKWRGVIRSAEFDTWRHDGAVERSRLPNKGDKERAA
jgi:hypothetical protein